MTSCQFTAVSNSIVDFIVSGPTVGHTAPENSNVIDGKTYTYYAVSYDAAIPPNITGWEAGSGPYVVATHKLQRITITANSDGTLIPLDFPLPPIVDVYESPTGSLEPALPNRGYLVGPILSTAGSSTTFSVAAGQATDSTNLFNIILSSAISKTTGSWAAGTGAGALDTGSTTNTTWYHAFLIKNPSNGFVDVLTSLSPTAPTLPTGYTLFRRLGGMKTNGSGQWTPFIQDGDRFTWLSAPADVNATNPGTSAVTRALSTPLGVRCEAIIYVIFSAVAPTDNPSAILITDLSITDVAPSASYATLMVYPNTANSVVPHRVFTNTSSQVRTRLQISSTNSILIIITNGWIDDRGRSS